MKKLAAVTVMVGMALGAFAQGTVNFANSSTSLIQTSTNDINGFAIVSAPLGLLNVALYAGSAGASQDALTLITTTGIGPVPGRFNAGSVTIPFLSAGGTGAFQIRAWSSTFATWEAALASADAATYVGATIVWNQATGNPTTEPPQSPRNLFAPDGGFPGLTIIRFMDIPEPASVALGVLGAGALLLFRRKK